MVRVFFWSVALTLLTVTTAISQISRFDSYFLNGLESYKDKDYENAIYYFDQALKIRPSDANTNYYLGICYVESELDAQALSSFERITPDQLSDPTNFSYYAAKANYRSQKAQLAEKLINKYLSQDKTPKKSDAEKLKKAIKQYLDNEGREGNFSIANLPVINTSDDELAPVQDPSKSYTLFVRTGKDEEGVVRRAEFPKELLNLQTFIEDNGRHAAPNQMENPFYRKKDRYALKILENKRLGRKKRVFFNQKGKLLYSIYEDGKWGSVAVEFEDSKKEQQIAYATLSQDLKTVILSKMNQDNNLDLYETHYNPKNKRWTKPKPIQVLNTIGNEVTPFLDESNTLYFSSTGHGAISASLDVFRSTFNPETGKWSAPENLYTPVNTAFNEAYFSIEEGVGYFCSNRKGRHAKGGMDIYRVYDFRYMKLRGNIYDRYLEEVVEGIQVSVRYADDLYAIDTVVTNERGYYEFEKLPVNRPLELFVTYKDKICYTERFVAKGFMLRKKKLKELVHNFYIHTAEEGIPTPPSPEDEAVAFFSESPKIGERFILKTVKFRSGTTDILPESMQELDRFADFLRKHPDLPKIEIGGHTDNIGDPDKNLELSEFRARRVVEYLVKKHKLAESRFTTAGYGETRPIASNDDEKEGRELNRRIEAKLVR